MGSIRTRRLCDAEVAGGRLARGVRGGVGRCFVGSVCAWSVGSVGTRGEGRRDFVVFSLWRLGRKWMVDDGALVLVRWRGCWNRARVFSGVWDWVPGSLGCVEAGRSRRRLLREFDSNEKKLGKLLQCFQACSTSLRYLYATDSSRSNPWVLLV